MIIEANLTLNESMTLLYIKQISYPSTFGNFYKTDEDLGFITCEIDGLFENLLMSFLLDEPARLKPIQKNINQLIFNFETKVGR